MHLFPVIACLLVLCGTAACRGVSSSSEHRHSRPVSDPSRPPPSGDISVHDPSGVVFDNVSSTFYAFGTGIRRGEFLASHTSTDGYDWQRGHPVFTASPAWVKGLVPLNTGTFWAPDIIQLNGLWHLYYAVSAFGSQTSCIALTINAALDASDPAFGWQDQGPVICSTPAAPYNTIDPHVLIDPQSSLPYMNFGSFWHGIFVVQLSGDRVVNVTVGEPVNVARDTQTGDPIEASWMQAAPVSASASGSNSTSPPLYLFVNWGQCCEGVNSTYNIRVGRSTSGPLGPFIDHSGRDMLQGGGTLLMRTQGRQVGPGQIGFPSGGGGPGSPGSNVSAPVISYHFYDAKGKPPGIHTLGQATLEWGEGDDAWPRAVDRM